MQSANSIYEAVHIYQRCEKRFYNTSFVRIEDAGELLKVSWLNEFEQEYRLATQASVSAFIRFLSQAFPQSYELMEIQTCFSDVLDWQRFYPCPVKKSKKRVRLTFNLAKSQEAQRDKAELIPSGLSSTINHSDTAELIQKVIYQLKKQLPFAAHSITEISALSGVSSRTLQRKLKGQQISFQYLLDSVREELACYYLEHTKLSGTEIGLLLGFSEQSAFTRAFKQWQAQTPSTYKKLRLIK